MRFTSLSLASKAPVLRLGPLEDRAEYNSLLHFEEQFNVSAERGVLAQLRASIDPIHHTLADRLDNLGITDWDVWADQKTPATDVISERPDATVLDLGGFATADEPLVVALAVLDDLWTRREERRPVLLIIDEAHNLCSPDLETPLGRAVREQLIRITAEGRKFGLWLLLSTQRPSEVHRSIISQCDNLALMRMRSPRDLAELASILGFAPEPLVAQSPQFKQGMALFAGGFIDAPTVLQIGARVTFEGGTDVGVPLRG